jgi:hypothetical protein
LYLHRGKISHTLDQELVIFELMARENTRRLRNAPYDPSYWLERGTALTQLRNPELGVGNFHKARLLIEALKSGKGGLGTWPAFIMV